MEINQNNLPQHQQGQGLATLSRSEKAVASVIVDINMIRLFPIEAEEIAVWAQTIVRIHGNVATPEVMREIMDNFLTAKWSFDPNIGIQNFMLGIKELTGETPSNWIAP